MVRSEKDSRVEMGCKDLIDLGGFGEVCKAREKDQKLQNSPGTNLQILDLLHG
jgi:hypothetical protein